MLIRILIDTCDLCTSFALFGESVLVVASRQLVESFHFKQESTKSAEVISAGERSGHGGLTVYPSVWLECWDQPGRV